ncbi:hypothetical protein ABT263_12550 [Kitasatospora sp. NPDC001603]|uniref:hypothetical protein n=1 Tax=Kitasatospora sp. NPDC001603 TaxID=3154388 RepID=UPI0033337C64
MTEKIFPTERLIPTLLYPVTGLAAGTPVLLRKLTAPQRERRAEAAALRAKRDEITAQAAEAAEAAFTHKLMAEADPVKRAAMLQAREAAEVTARQIELEQAKAARKEQRTKLGDTAGAAALLLIVGGPLIWSLARPWIQPGIGLLLGVWWIAALIHAPAHRKAAPAEGEEDQEQAVPAVEEEPAEEDPVEAPRATVPTPVETHSLTASLTASGCSVLLTRLAADLGAAHPSWTGSTKAVRALLSQAGVPVREGVRTPDGNGPGVHHQDVPPLPSPSETPAVANVGPGQSANANANNTREWSTREGFVMQTDPDNPARTIIVGRSTAA